MIHLVRSSFVFGSLFIFFIILETVVCQTTEGTTKATELFLRLRDGDSPSSGRVEVSKDNATWGTVCDDYWEGSAADVVCRYFNYTWGIAHNLAHYGAGDITMPIFLDQVLCTGFEKSLLECNTSPWGEHNCNHSEDAGVSCFTAKVRLNKAKTQPNIGLVQMINSNKWAEVCDDEWDDVDAGVLCRELGYVSGQALQGMNKEKDTPKHWMFNDKILKYVRCTGNESSVVDCPKRRYAAPGCPLNSYAGVICHNTTIQNINKTFGIRIENGNTGVVEVHASGVWGHLCNSKWSDEDANMVCRSKGFKGGVVYGTNVTKDQIGWIGSLKCDKSDKGLLNCNTSSWRPSLDCIAASVLCYNKSAPVISMSGGSFGKVQIDYEGKNGTICARQQWTSTDARVVCRQMGYADGKPFIAASGGSGPIYMNNIQCDGDEFSILACQNTGWLPQGLHTECTSHNSNAGVMCFRTVRLSMTDNQASGIVEIYLKDVWYGLCGTAFNDINAKVACKSVGYKNGKALNRGAFGKYYNSMVRPNIDCSGNESSILDCPYSLFSTCKTGYYGYASVACFNGPVSDETIVTLKAEVVGTPSYGLVSINKHGVDGQVCASYWEDSNAMVVCRQLGFLGGRATVHPRAENIPVIVTDYHCSGNESKLSQCREDHGICYSNNAAGVICYNTSAPRIRLDGGTRYYGRVVIDLDGREGTICDSGWNDFDAEVICRQMNFESGKTYEVSPGSGSVFLSSIDCSGAESSIFVCPSDGWRSVKRQECLDHKHDVGVFCFGNVRIQDGKTEPGFVAGRLQMMTSNRYTWTNVCAKGFGPMEAKVVCKDLGYDVGEALAPGSFGVDSVIQFVKDLKCNGTEESIKECTYKIGLCEASAINYASVLCYNKNTPEDYKIYVEDGFNGQVTVQRFGINGTICIDGWGEEEANVTCKSAGYTGGVVIGPPESYVRSSPVWYTDMQCTGLESTLRKCSRNETVPLSCMTSFKNAGVLCYNSTGVQIRLANGKKHYGRVEISYDGVWGTVCDQDWTKFDARVLCRQLGYPDGRGFMGSHYGKGTGPVYISGLYCDNTEDTLLSCPSKGWNQSPYYCEQHQNDAGVYCYRPVSVTPGEDYGRLRVWSDSRYVRVCQDNFTDVEATIACRDMGYSYGKSICCSQFGEFDSILIQSRIKCSGREVRLSECETSSGLDTCANYASVVCTDNEPIGYGLKLEHGQYGRVQLNYYDHVGYLCTEGYDNNDANVICKKAGFLGGFGYFQIYGLPMVLPVEDIWWLKNLTCNGSESRLEECGALEWGNVGRCSKRSFPSAFCYSTEEQAGTDIRLTGGNIPSEGLVQLKINGTWGTICGLSKKNAEATVLCRQLGYTYGVFLKVDTGTGPVWIKNAICNGNESSIYECILDGIGGDKGPVCETHRYDLAIKCFSNVRLAGAMDHYGPLQLFDRSDWHSICDDGFSDVSARVACRSMGYNSGRAQCCSARGFYPGYSKIGYSEVNCTGKEARFADCPMTQKECKTRSYVTLLCTDQPLENYDVDFRINGGHFYGHIEIKRYGSWGAVCERDWDNNDAKVFCRQLGFTTGNATRAAITTDLPILVTGVHCNGSEQNLTSCHLDDFDSRNSCGLNPSIAAVVCSKDEDGIQYRIADKYDDSGRVEVYLNGNWGTVCNLNWDNDDANVFCKQLGNYVAGIEVRPRVEAPDDRPIWMTSVGCRGNETNLLQCYARWDASAKRYCTHKHDAGVKCYKSVRLNRGDERSNGIVEIYNNNKWGTICSHSFNEKEAAVVCRILGYEHGIPLCCSPFGYSFRGTIIGGYSCAGNETHMTDCTPSLVQSHKCFPQNYASVACYNGQKTQAYDVRLVGNNAYTGPVNLTFMGIEGRICADDWDDKDARVVCKELGFPNGIAYHHYKPDFVFIEYSGPYWTSKVNCTGDETHLGACPHVGFGEVTECQKESFAGVLCYDEDGIYYELVGQDNNGYVNVSVRGQWGTVCGRFWDQMEADVFCRQLGYSTGDPKYGQSGNEDQGIVWETNFRCSGEEDNLNKCPHEGWRISRSRSCQSHKDDAGVLCYTNVKLANGFGRKTNFGAVMYYQNKTWHHVCDTDFTDLSARKVCQELGFTDGRAICCSAFGEYARDTPMLNQTLSCTEREKSLPECLTDKKCTSQQYASVVCFQADEEISESDYTFKLNDQKKGPVIVEHLGVQGRICSNHWDDNEARVFCRRQGYTSGIAYQHDKKGVLESLRKPFWLSDFNCTGNEHSLIDCPHHARLDLGNCSDANFASVLCFNASGIDYRLANGQSHYGRVEVKIEDVWGTVCDAYWDNREAGVLCRQLNYTDGVAIPGAAYGQGKGAIWMSHLQCTGDEAFLHRCPHRGFNDQFAEASWPSWLRSVVCDTHEDDASVFCYKHARLNEGYDATSGGLELHHKGVWGGVCDTGFDDVAARVACKSLGRNYVDGRAIAGSAFGKLNNPINIISVKCKGTESDISDCKIVSDNKCTSNQYVSLYCSNKTVEASSGGLKVRIAPDSLSSGMHGILEVQKNGVWGRVCMKGWDDKDAQVACRHMGYAGGVAYLHIMKNRSPILIHSLYCTGSEQRLDDCPSGKYPDLENCNFNSNDAGVLCYNSTGLNYRLRTKTNNPSNTGRVEIEYDGVWGTVCSWSWQSADARVFCRQLGYNDGIVDYDVDTSASRIRPWVTGYFCQGNETTMMSCLNTGFNSSFLDDLCLPKEPGAYSACYHREVEPTNIRLSGGQDKYAGRVEVYISGPNKWGTICDDFWDDSAATVVCRHLGFGEGKAVKEAKFGPGTGPIWFDNVRCVGNESKLFQCSHRGIGTHNCNHTEDVGVICAHPVATTTTITYPPSPTTKSTTTAMTTTKETTTVTTTPTTSTKTTTATTTTPKTITSTKASTTFTKTTTTRPTTTTTKITSKPPTTTTTTTTSSTSTTTATTTTTTPSTTTITTEASTVPTSVAENNETSANATSGKTSQEEIREITPAAIAVFVVVIIILIAITILTIVCVVRIRKLRKADVPHRRFHDDNGDQQGTIGIENQLYELNLDSTGNGFGGEPTFDKTNKDITLERNGNAHFSNKNKQVPTESSSSHAFSNPLYEQMKPDNLKQANHYDELEPLPEGKELSLNHVVSDSNA